MRTPKYGPWSYSKINAWLECPRKFKYWYVDKVPMEWEDTVPTQRGTLIHLIFELNRDLKKIKAHKDFKDILQKKILSPEDIKGCFKVYDSFVKSKEGQSIMSKTRLFAELPLGLDHELNFTRYDDSPFLRGYVDAAFVNENNDKSMVIVDWKSGRHKPKDKQDWTQLLYYSIGMFSANPNLEKVVLAFVYVEHNKMNLKIVTRDELPRYKQSLYNTTDKIEEDVVFPKNQTHLCDYCFYRHHCDSDVTTDGLTNEDIPF
jgi:CRISPR/Cas system-associated exonuclease Cas4 (RecB family)